MFVSIEGINGVGKTAIVQRICQLTNFEQYDTPDWLHSASVRMDSTFDLDARYLLFMSAMSYNSNRIRPIVASGGNVIVSGFYKRTIAYHRGMGSTVEFSRLPELIEPNLSILLTCNEEKRLRRLSARDRPTNVWDEFALKKLSSIIDLYNSYNLPTIDTSDLSIDAVVARVLSIIDGQYSSR